jgi:transposase-like protein
MGRSYTEEQRAAVMAALLTGQSINAVAREYRIPKGTVSRWNQEKGAILSGGPKDTDIKKAQMGELLLDYLGEALRTLRKQVRAVGDENYIKQQPASEIAVLHGVIADKTIRLLEALAPDNGEGTDL